jgi:ubiquinone/menaquinone biosynthesis C-methylase UbiE
MSRESSEEFNKIANQYDKGRLNENIEFWAKETQRIVKLDEQNLILDLGCGTGIYTKALKDEICASLAGFDPGISMLEQARRKSKEIFWFNAVGECLPLREGVFDCIFSSQVWHHIQDKQGTANECRRILKDEGSTIIRTISHDQLHKKVVFQYFPEIKSGQLMVYPSNKDFKQYFRKAGFKETEFHEYNIERYQSIEEFIDIAKNKLWSMFREISEDGLENGVAKLRRYKEESGNLHIRNDELIILVVNRK